MGPLAHAVRNAMTLSKEERDILDNNEYRRVDEKKNTWPTIADQMKRAYEWVLKDGEKPDCVRVM
jgi:hypothetical protein